MTAIADQAIGLAYRGQQASWQAGCAAAQRIMRRVLLGYRPRFGRDEARSLFRRYQELLDRDLEHARAGDYPTSLLFQIPYRDYARQLPRLLLDVPRVLRRMRLRDHRDLPAEIDLNNYPAYYRRNFHWQSDGYLSRRSAELYDLGVEFLFGGTGDVMRRRVIPPITALARERGTGLRILDVACGTGRTLEQIHRALPSARLVGLDLSAFYLDAARNLLGRKAAVEFVEGNAESMPFEEASIDVVTCVFTFHELPHAVRRRVVAEMHRVLRPGGLLVLLDSVQEIDAPDIAYFMARFVRELHEPFYNEYLKDDLAQLVSDAGFELIGPPQTAFLAKVVTATR